jgi:hypothetical protein
MLRRIDRLASYIAAAAPYKRSDLAEFKFFIPLDSYYPLCKVNLTISLRRTRAALRTQKLTIRLACFLQPPAYLAREN